MTLTNRNRCYKAGIAAGILALIIVTAAGILLLPVYEEAQLASSRRSEGIFQRLVTEIAEPAPFVPFFTMACTIVYSLAGIILVLYFFEKTQSPEILFMGLFIMSFVFECIRIVIPLKIYVGFPNVYLTNSFRFLFFGRYFGLFSIFAASIYAAGLNIQKQQNIIFIYAMISMIFALGVPVDMLSWDTTLVLLSNFNRTFAMVETWLIIITIASFFVAAYTKGSHEYIIIGTGAVLIFAGRNILFGSDTWISPVPGLILVSIGTWLVCSKFHRIYLWL